MPSEKIKGIWPLPGGTRNYVITLRKILERVDAENPSKELLLSWLKSEFKLSGNIAPLGYLRVVKETLNFIQEIDGQLKLTFIAGEFMKTGDNRLVFEALHQKVLGIDEILSMLADGKQANLAEVHNELVKRCNVEWSSHNQTMFRLYWLLSIGYVSEKNKNFFLEQKGIDAVRGTLGKIPLPSPPVAAKPIDDYIKRALDLVKRYPTMNERNTISNLIEPLLNVLGWGIWDLDEVQREFPIRIGERTEYVDIGLKVNNKTVMFIEAKSLDTPLYDYMAEQPLKYANAEGVNWCVLSNGQEWRVYNAFWRIKGIEHKMLLKISIDEFIEKMNKLLLLSKESILSGNLEREGEGELAERIIVNWFRQKESIIIKEILELDSSLKEENVRNALKKITRSIREKIN